MNVSCQVERGRHGRMIWNLKRCARDARAPFKEQSTNF
jgi:hypothetical protein